MTVLRSLLLTATALTVGTAAHAQQTAATIAAPDAVAPLAESAPAPAAPDSDLVVVTGSRIRSLAGESVVPITSINANELLTRGSISIGDALNDLPSLRSTFSTGNSQRFIGTTGLALLDLRGLGTARTLVVVNGRRHVGGTIGDNDVDTNSIPADLLDRVDIVTGGSSAVYGSDAVAGVVNFVLKRDFDGFQIKGQSGISDRKDRPTQFIAGVLGRNFAEGRANVAVSAEYSRQESIFNEDRPTTRLRQLFNLVQIDQGGASADGVPDRESFTDTRSIYLSEGGTFARAVDVNNPLTFLARTGQDGVTVRVPRVYRFQNDGTLREADYGTRDFRFATTSPGNLSSSGPNNTFGGDGATLRRYGTLQPDIERFSINALGHFEITPAFEPYFEAKYSRLDFVQESSPTFGQTAPPSATFGTGVGGYAANSVGIPIQFDNAFLNPQAAALLRRLTTPTASFVRVTKNLLDLGSRGEDGRRETYRIVGGVRGKFFDTWNYDIGATYGQVDIRTVSLNNRLQQRFQLAVDAVRNPAGQIVCRSQIVAPAPLPETNANGSPNTVNIARNRQLANDIARCVPLNIFGEGNISAAARDYVNVNTVFTGRNTQFDVLGSISGDSGRWFELPGGPIAFSIGAEYRRETARSSYGDVVGSGLTFLNAIPDFRPPGAVEVAEGFSELRVPLVKDVFLLREVTLTGAMRYSSYNNSTGGVFAWNAGGVWSPVRGLRFRGNFARSVRAPTLSDLYSAATQNFSNITDPCDALQINSGSPTRARNCAADGAPTNFINGPARSASTELLSSGNPNLREETSTSYTVGGVYVPSFLKGAQFQVDYYNIEIKNVIQSVSAQLIANLCYDAPTLANSFCPNVSRIRGNTADPNYYTFARPGVIQSTFNFATRRSRGLDIDISYRTKFGEDNEFTLRAIGTRTFTRDNFPDVSNPGFRDQVLGELGDPEWAANFELGLRHNRLSLGYKLRFLDKMYTNFIEDIRSVNGGPPQNADYSSPLFYPEIFYHDIRLDFAVKKDASLYLGVDNASDELPPLGLTGIGEGSGIYDNVGRFLYVGVRFKLF